MYTGTCKTHTYIHTIYAKNTLKWVMTDYLKICVKITKNIEHIKYFFFSIKFPVRF
jgi:hypothetical protein